MFVCEKKPSREMKIDKKLMTKGNMHYKRVVNINEPLLLKLYSSGITNHIVKWMRMSCSNKYPEALYSSISKYRYFRQNQKHKNSKDTVYNEINISIIS